MTTKISRHIDRKQLEDLEHNLLLQEITDLQRTADEILLEIEALRKEEERLFGNKKTLRLEIDPSQFRVLGK